MGIEKDEHIIDFVFSRLLFSVLLAANNPKQLGI